MTEVAIGLDVGGTKILGGLVEAGTGRVLAEHREHTPAGIGAGGIMDALVATIAALSGRAAVCGIGVSSAGHVDWETGIVVDGTPNIPGWAGTAVGPELASATGLAVCCDNDGNAAAFGEAWVGAGKGKGTVVAITLGTGFGAGIYDRGHMLRGAKGGGAEVGHLVLFPEGRPCNCGQQGCVEAYLSGTALTKQARRLWGEAASSHDIFDRAAGGDAAAGAVLDEFSHGLALVFVSLFNLCDPDVILVGGGIASRGAAFMPKARAELRRLLGGKRFDVDAVQMAQLGERAGMVGAAGEALARFVGRGAVRS
ncbi:MAG: ROK family protein [Cyanobacteria bacterium REEB65]|nr:ROK family protein [Cyanobacteria bacterium REEB65]